MKKFLLVVLLISVFLIPIQAKTWRLWGDGHSDDTKALKAWGRGEKVEYKGRILGKVLEGGKFYVTKSIIFIRGDLTIKNNIFLIKRSGLEIYPIDNTNIVSVYIIPYCVECSLSSINDNGRKN